MEQLEKCLPVSVEALLQGLSADLNFKGKEGRGEADGEQELLCVENE